MRPHLFRFILAALLLSSLGCNPDPANPSDPIDTGLDTVEEPTDTATEADSTVDPPPDAADTDPPETDTGSTPGRTLADYRRCTTDVDCPVGLGVCVKSVPLNRADTDGTKSIGVGELFPRLKAGEGICTKTCTNTPETCSDLSVNGSEDDPRPHTCQLVVEGEAPYPDSPPELPFDDQLDPNELADGQPFGAICRPPVELDPAVDDAFCTSCQMPAGCSTDGALCWNPATDAPAADGESGTCLSACQADGDCPLGFRCQAGDGNGQKFCRPLEGTCGKCRDLDGDGFGTGLCREAANQVTGHDCDDRNPDAYYDPKNMKHPFPTFCGVQDYNCNGKSDDVEQIGAGSDKFPEQHCTACFDSCSGPVPEGEARCQNVGTKGSFCLAECSDGPDADNLPDFADCDGKLSNGCETKVDDPDRVFFRDADGDGYGDPNDAKFACRASTAPAGFVANRDDCNDSEPTVYGGANPSAEICDGLDNDCDGDTDADDADLTKAGQSCTSNNPGVCRPGSWSCQGSAGWTCKSAIEPGDKTETCQDAKDNDCDGQVNEQWDRMMAKPAAPLGYQEFYPDGDNDGYGKKGSSVVYACSDDNTVATTAGDCDDGDAQVNPGADEKCSTKGVDDNCNGQADEGTAADAQTWYDDTDGDMYGDPNVTTRACAKPKTYVDNKGDCQPGDRKAHPGATERCSTRYSDDCDSSVHDAPWSSRTYYYSDRDGDMSGDPNDRRRLCFASGDYITTDNDDCRPGDEFDYPNAAEQCNGVDDNCANGIDEGCPYSRLSRGTTSPKGIIGSGDREGSGKTGECPAGFGYAWTRASIAHYGTWPLQEVDVGCERMEAKVVDPNADPYAYELSHASNSQRWYDSASFGSSGSTRSSFSCGDGEAIYKIRVQWDEVMYSIKLFCRSYKLTGSAGQSWTVTRDTNKKEQRFGGNAKHGSVSECPPGEVAVGLKTWKGWYFYAAANWNHLADVELLCAPLQVNTK